MAVARTARIDAVNTMLSVIGEAPVNDLSASSSTADVIIAQNILDEVSREIQSHGWSFNREVKVDLVPSSANNITVSESAASVEIERGDSPLTEYVLRGNRLYDKTNHTYTITRTLKATVIYMLDWDELPQAARNYIMIRAARRFQDRVVGSEKHHQFNQVDEFQALVSLRSYEADTADYSIFDNYDVLRVVDRGSVINRVTT